MTDASVFNELAQSLRERLRVIGDREARDANPVAHLEQLRAVSERINALQAALPGDIDPQLRHYLQRCSYDKALAFLENHSG